ncbi:MAG: Ig-like domain-containing protein, partial [Pyrinomonadaceae bacterium]|nr:Ig-like domain-containing protein [Pyrinomonadaceae bacterium]
MKNLISLLIIFSIWNSLFAPISSAQNSNTNSVFTSAKSKSDEPEKEKKGLQFRVREGKPEAVPRTSPTPVSASKLGQSETDSILKRLTPLPADEKSDFKLRSDSLPPPKNGTIINTKFPADESQNLSKINDSKQLEVIRFSPNGNVGVTPEISITFSQPMIAVTSQTEASETVPVKLTPAVKGKWRWLGTRVLIFDAENRLPMATKFTAVIPAGTKSAIGGTLTKDISWEFSTNPPKIESFSAKSATVTRDEKLFASFDQNINPAEILKKMSANTNGQKIPLRLLTEAEMSKEIEEIKKEKPEMLKRIVGFRAAELLPPDSVIYLNFDKGLPSAEGNLVSTEPQVFIFKTFGILKFVKSTCGYENKTICEPSDSWEIKFNNSIDEKVFDKSQVKIEPSVKEPNFSIYGNEIDIRGDFRPRTAYKITILNSLKDDFGQTLGQDVSAQITTGGREPKLESSHYKDFLTIAPISKPIFSVFSTNYSTLKVKIYAVTPENYQAFLDFRHNDDETYPKFGKLVFDKPIKIKNIQDEEIVTDISLAPALKNGIGHAVLIVEPPVKDENFEPIAKWIQVTNIGLDAFADDEQLNVYVSNLRDGKPLGNVQMSLANSSNGVSDDKGMANLKLLPSKNKTTNYLIAKQGNDSAILTNGEYYNYEEENGWFLGNNKDSLRWFVFDDRKMYRPGDTVSIKGYLRKITGGKLSDISELADAVSKVDYVLKDAKNIEIAKGSAQLNAFGAFDLQLKLPETINLGYQRLELKTVSNLDEKETFHNFQVQEFRRPEFEVNTEVESSAPFYLGDSATIVTEAKYFSGGGLANAETDWDISASPTDYTPPNREDFTFGTFTPWWGYHYRSDWESRTSEDFKSKTDFEGKHRVALDFVKANPARPYKIEARANIQDVNRQTFSGSTSLLVHPSKLYVGLRTPKTFVQAGEPFKLETITTDIDGKSVADAPVSITAELKDWQQVKGEWQDVVVDTQKCELKSASDVSSCDFTAKQGGTYTITARVLDEKERPNESELTVWVAGGKRETVTDVQKQDVELIPDKKEYEPNETAEILLNVPFSPAEGMMTLERNGIVKTERFTLDKSSTVLKIPIEEGYLPNIHVQVTLVGASSFEYYGDDRDKDFPKIPAYATGELNLEISTDSRKLNVTAEPLEKNLQPAGQTKINIAVTDNYGKAVANSEVALVAVDESILALTGYKISNPLDVFYQQFNANTNDTHSREDILLNLDGIGFGRGGGQGNGSGDDEPPPARANPVLLSGDSPYTSNKPAANTAANVSATPSRDAFEKPKLPPSAKMDQVTKPELLLEVETQGNRKEKPSEEASDSLQMMQLRRNFAATAIFAPSVKTDVNGKAIVDLKLPDNLTRYRITAVAVTNSKQFGLGESNVTARQPLQIRPSAPRFMNFGDKIELPVVLQNQTDAPMTIDVAIRASNATLTDGNGKKVTVPAQTRAEIRFPVTAEKAGIARFQIGASSQNFADAAEIEFPVYTPATTEAFATYGTTDQNGAIVQPISTPKDVYSDFGGLEISSSSTQLQELTDAFIYLQSYPFECSEQISSRILSVAALRDVLTAFNAKDMPNKAAIEAKMKSDIQRLQKLQHSDGGFSFWRNDDESFPYLSVHVAHALARAKAKGYVVPKEM